MVFTCSDVRASAGSKPASVRTSAATPRPTWARPFGPGDLLLGDRIGAALGEDAAGVVPGQLAHRGRCGAKVPPERGDPAAFAVIAYPEAGDVVGVVADFPPPATRSGARRLPSKRRQLRTVVGAMPDADAVGVDRSELPGQQTDVFLRAERDRDVAGGGDQGGVLLVRAHRPPGYERVPQPVVRAVLPGDDPRRQLRCPEISETARTSQRQDMTGPARRVAWRTFASGCLQ